MNLKSLILKKYIEVINFINFGFDQSFKIDKTVLCVPNLDEAKWIYRCIFQNKDYKFSSEGLFPFIIDIGAHVGIAAIYFKKLYPNSEIICIEPNPLNIKCFKENKERLNLQNVTLLEAAAYLGQGEINFYVDPRDQNVSSWGGTVKNNFWSENSADVAIKVPIVNVSSLINKNVDLIKVDAEGSELEIIEEIKNKLYLVKEMIIEFHENENNPFANKQKLLNILRSSGFEVTLQKADFEMIRAKKNKSK